MKFDNVVIKNKFLFISLGITIVLGIILRLLFYSYNRPLWSDEAALALNIINMNSESVREIPNGCQEVSGT